MDKLGSGFITTPQDVDRLEFDWGKIHFLSEPAVTGAKAFSFGLVDLEMKRSRQAQSSGF